MATREAGPDGDALTLTFTAELWQWRGPAPFHFITVPDEASAAVRDLASVVSYGWGMIPVNVRIGGSTWGTSLFPKDGRYVLPVRDAARHAEGLALGDAVTVQLVIRH